MFMRIGLFAALIIVAPAALTKAAEIEFVCDKAGSVSLAVYDSKQHMVREILRAAPLNAGKHRVDWDGLDWGGRPATPGLYEWRSLQTQGLRAEFLMSLGTSVGESWWPGNHGGPAAIAIAQDSMVLGAIPEGPPLLVRCGINGDVIWEQGPLGPARIPYDIAIGGNSVFYLQDDGNLFKLDFATGKVVAANARHKAFEAYFPMKTFDFRKKTPQNQRDSGAKSESITLSRFDERRGTGWDRIDGLISTPRGIVSSAIEPRTFQCSIPNGQYFVRFTIGATERDTTLVEVQSNGMEPPKTHRLAPDKMAGWLLPITKVGEAPKTIILPQLYELPRAVEVKDGRLEIKFIPNGPASQQPNWCLQSIEILALAQRVAANADSLVMSNGAAGILWINPSNGSVIDTAPLSNVRDIAVTRGGDIIALLSDSIVSLNRKSKTPVTQAKGFVDPVAIDVDQRTGDVVVAEGGNCQQVRCFDSQFALKATYGRNGGRLYGRYDPHDFAGLCGIACDGHGGFVATERSAVPRRTVHFSANGTIREWFGGMDYYATTALDPDDSSIGWMRQDNENIIQIKIDYVNRQWRPLATYRWTNAFDSSPGPSDAALFSLRTTYGPWMQANSTSQRMRCLRRDLDGDGKTELLLEFSTLPMLLVQDETADQLRPLAAMGVLCPPYYDATDPMPIDQLPAAWVEAIRRKGGNAEDAKSRIKFARYSWADENGDGQIDAEELQLGSAPTGPNNAISANGGHCMRIDTDFNVFLANFSSNIKGLFTKIEPRGFTKCGAPIWPLAGKAGPLTERRGSAASLLTTADGGSFVLLRGNGDGLVGRNGYDPVAHGWDFPSNLADGMSITRLDDRGNHIWQSGFKAARFPHPRGQLHGAWHLMGSVNGCIAVADWVEQPCEFWTTEGLYVGGLFDGRDPWDGHDLARPGSTPDRLYTWLGTKGKRIGVNDFSQYAPLSANDMRAGGDVGRLPDGSVVFVGQGANNNPCYRITGWDGWVHQRGKILIDIPAIQTVQLGAGLNSEYFSNSDFTSPVAISHEDGVLWFDYNKPWPKDVTEKSFSVRWSGLVEPRFSEEYCFSIYARGDFKLAIDGNEVTWAKQDYPRDKVITKRHSMPIRLKAGHRIPVQIEFRATMPQPSFHFNWESLSQPVEHVPVSALTKS